MYVRQVPFGCVCLCVCACLLKPNINFSYFTAIVEIRRASYINKVLKVADICVSYLFLYYAFTINQSISVPFKAKQALLYGR